MDDDAALAQGLASELEAQGYETVVAADGLQGFDVFSARQPDLVIWKGAPAPTADSVRVQVGALRRKLEPEPSRPRYIVTEPRIGYRFAAEPLA
ncbi:MAG: DNA-binding response regulator [Thermoanaerobaculia bacterium]|nr:DNA-binding response regulator [Thermoanaerobaculia bacterium]